jgi:hypothetical protein
MMQPDLTGNGAQPLPIGDPMMMGQPPMGQPPMGQMPLSGPMMGGPPIPTPLEITNLVDAHERYRETLTSRMETDWNLVTLTEFDAGDGYQSYTSNEPMTSYDKMTTTLSSGAVKIRIPVVKAQREKRERESAKERFLLGLLKANDERLGWLGEQSLLTTLSAFINLRGWYCGRCLLVKDENTGETYLDVTPWDPMHVSWGMGAKGLKWVCNKTKKTSVEIFEQYGYRVDSNGTAIADTSFSESYFDSPKMDESEGVDVYDWYDEFYNIVVIGDTYVKEPLPHGAGLPGQRTPSFFGSVGSLPLIQSKGSGAQGNLVHHGESIFAANRNIYERMNLVLSTMLQMVALSRNQAFTYTSRDGQKTLDENPFLEGAQTPLAEGERLDLLPLLEMSRDTGAFLGLITSEVQRGALPYSVYGQLAFQLSGYAVNLLKQATDSPLLPRKQAIESAYRQITNLITDQFATGAFGAIQLQGWDQNRDWFDQEFTPDMMQGLPAAEITLMVKTPQDDMQNVQMAKMLSDGPWPALPMRVIWDEILGYQDTDSIADAIKEEVAEKFLPEAALMTILQAVEKQGRPELAQIYYGELVKQAIMNQPGAGENGGGGAGGPPPASGTPGFSPESISAPEQGAPNPDPTPQAGPIAPAGSPRPGARISP